MMPFDKLGNGRGVLVNRSSNGLDWSRPIVAVSSLGVNGHWLACDNNETSPYYGNCYDAVLDYSLASVNKLITSSDGGLTWTSPVTSPDQNAGLVTSIAIQPNGNLVVLGRTGGKNFDQEYAIPSADGGRTLGPTADITTNRFTYPYMRADPDPTSGVDSRGTIYVVFPDCRFRSKCVDPATVSACRFSTDNKACPTNDLVLTKSTDGIHWSALQRIPIDPLASSDDHLISGLGVLSNNDDEGFDNDEMHAKLALTYYYVSNGKTCSPSKCRVNAGFISSDDGGQSWHDAKKIAGPMSETWLVPTYAGAMVAGYISSVFVDGKPYSALAIARRPDPETGKFNEAIYTVRLPGESE
jgi:hypothetical protein